MNKNECDLLENESYDCETCADKKTCPNARGGINFLYVGIFLGFFGALAFCLYILSQLINWR